MKNLRTNLIILTLLMTMAFATSMWFYAVRPSNPRPQYIPPRYNPDLHRSHIPSEDEIGRRIVNQINSRNAIVRSMMSPSMKMSFRKEGRGGSIEGLLAFEQDRRFRMIQRSFFGKEIDLGSNETHFWFWSRRMKPRGLYYARHENVMRTGLRTPFNPIWMMEVLGMKDITIQNGFVARYTKYWVIVEERMSTEQRLVKKVTLVDPDLMAVVGHYIYDLSGKILVSAEIRNFYRYNGVKVPKKVDVIWFEENVTMKWDIGEPRVNIHVDPRFWVMPQKENMKELGNVTSFRSFWQLPDDVFVQSLVDPY